MSPKIVNGSFAALFDNNDVKVDFSKKLQQLKQDTKDSGIKLFSMQTNIDSWILYGFHSNGVYFG